MTDAKFLLIRDMLEHITETDAVITAASDLRRDLGLDSLDIYEVMMDLEDEFGIDLDEDAVAACVTVADLVWLVEVANG